MQDLPGARQDLTPPVRALDVDHQSLTLSTIRLGYIGTSAHWKGSVQIRHRRSRLLHQVLGHNHRTKDTQFCIPRALVSDNGKQFDNSKFRDFCAELGIKNYYSSPAHPQSNSQAEVTIRTLKVARKTKLEDLKGKWVEYLPEVL